MLEIGRDRDHAVDQAECHRPADRFRANEADAAEARELDALAVICKAADLDRALFLTYAVVLLNTDDNAMGKARAYAGMYNELTREAALRTLRFWRARKAMQAA